MARPRGTTAERKFGPRPGANGPARDPSTSAEYLYQKVRLVRATTEKVALQIARIRGEFLPADEVKSGWEAAIGRARALLLGIPPDVAARLVMIVHENGDDAAAAERAIRRHLTWVIDEALAELANTSVEDSDDEADAALAE